MRDVLRTADSVTPVRRRRRRARRFTLLYLFLAATVVSLLWRQIAKSPRAVALGPGAGTAEGGA